MKLNFVLIIFIGFLTASCMQKYETKWHILSPDGKLKAIVTTNENGRIKYSHKNGGETVIESSPMGVVFEEAIFDKGLVFTSKDQVTEKTDNYTLISGKKLENKPK
jgi:hypothetical protein